MTRTKDPTYPQWICDACGQNFGTWYKKGTYVGPPHHYATYHEGSCDLCKQEKVPVTEPRDYGHLHAKWKEQYYS